MTQHSRSESGSHRIALAVEYDGSAYSGWQKQQSPELVTVQSTLEQALSQVADVSCATSCAGRTDTGVHATCQVIHFDCHKDRGNKAWTRGVNSLLPDSLRVIWSKAVNADFHARFSATARRYLYVMHCSESASALLAGRICHVRHSLDVAAMNEAAQYLLGEQDFTSFRAAGCQSSTAKRKVMKVSVRQIGELVVFDIKANAFLQHMVRNISGALLLIGRGEQTADWMGYLMQEKDRTQAGAAAVPDGLYLVQVDYPERYSLPLTVRWPIMLGASGPTEPIDRT